MHEIEPRRDMPKSATSVGHGEIRRAMSSGVAGWNEFETGL